MATDEEVRKLAAKGWSDEIDALFEGGLPDSQMKILVAAGLFDDDDDDDEADDGLPPALDDEVDLAIQDLLDQADELAEESRFLDAIRVFAQALEKLPEPQMEYDYAMHGYAGIGDAHFLLKDFNSSLDAFEKAKMCEGGIANPFIHLRLGQCYLELKQEDNSADNLTRAYMSAGMEIFEDEDPVYLKFLKTKITLE